ncbi:hypothetical protein OSB04_027811 [Centaurea solstitialis]|uniref:Protein kinase domain-containing protein n=1 Tax=Centaurea solstitialis TaxID=347529 RepID=A0AA38SEJ1_9ASTR|nr:hypothetical protein OSB04_027811 [Centaurea solstitialis]
MKLYQISHLHIILLSLITTSAAALKYSKDGCEDKCGNVTIPYPFGIGASCSINEWYVVDCNSSTPYLSALNHLEVLSISLVNGTVTVNAPTIYNCQNHVRNTSVDLGSSSPFFISKSQNIFVLKGYCGNALIMDGRGNVLAGCSTSCSNYSSTSVVSESKSCFGISCCQTTIPNPLQAYSLNLTGLERESGVEACGSSAFLVDKNSYDEGEGSFSSQFIGVDKPFAPILLIWILRFSEFDNQLPCCDTGGHLSSFAVDLGNGTSVFSRACSMLYTYEGNPYLPSGCNENDVCARCDKESYCGYVIDHNREPINFTCRGIPDKFPPLGVILGVSISMGLLLTTAVIYVLYKVIKKTKARRRRERFFIRNGGLLLKQQQEADQSLVDKTILFTLRELEKATDYFNENRILGQGGQGTVYKGMLVDGRIVAVKKSKAVDENQLEQFINEVVILSQVNHRNVVKLLGCCLETEVPLLVSEFISNGNLYDHIHNDMDEFPISLNVRLQIATEVAGALSYLHSETSIPIYHRDFSDFGTSRFVSIDQTHLTTLVKGTFGYLDPEYFQSSQFTEKSDVYSFGVVLVELLTGEKPISLTRFGENKSLATHFMLAMEEGRVMSIFDAMVIKEGTRDELLAVANVAMRCLYLNGKNRPTMKEVAVELESIIISHVPSMVQTDIRQMIYREGFATLSYGDSSSTFNISR